MKPVAVKETARVGDGALTFREFAIRETLPLATIQQAVFEFLRGRNDAIIFGAQAVNAYVDEPRMTQYIDILSPRAAELAEELRNCLNQRFHIALRIRRVAEGRGYRLFQVQKPKNRHLVDIRLVATLPPVQRISEILVVTPPELIASKVIAFHRRRGKPLSGTDWRDLALLLLTFPELKTNPGPVVTRLEANGADPMVLDTWKKLASRDILPEDEDEGF